jgi:hypothetical protein
MDDFDVRVKRNTAPGEDYFNRQAKTMASEGREIMDPRAETLDSDESKAELRRLLEWFYHEKEKQSLNRLEMAMDADFYDNLQWDPDDAQVLRDRGQMPLVYNEVAPMVDWVIGTERRTRVDWRVLPRTEDDVEMADTKTKVLKYVSDINRVPFVRSRAFADAVKSGVGWIDDGVRDDPTQDILYSKYEDWRNVIWDSSGYELDLSDSRYLFRWRWVDEDIAMMMFPGRRHVISSAVEEAAHYTTDGWEEDTWYSPADMNNVKTGTLYASGVGQLADAKRRRVKLIECQYRKPATVKVVADGPLKGLILNNGDEALANAVATSGSFIVDKVMMRVHIAVFTESHMLGSGPSIFRHNRFSLTPIWCYRRGRDRLPYGIIRRVRDIQQDLNKRASKALFLLNTNQIIADEGAVDDFDVLRDEADRPDGLIVKKPGKEIVIRRDTDAATGQIQMMTLDAQGIQKSAGVSQENLGRQTNAVSGEAIKARQLQGSVVTTEPFDNLRFATQVQGEKQLSLTEQFYTQEKVVRLTGSKGALEWVKINVPEVQADGSVRFINDITASAADFVVSEQDYAGTLRQVMFESLNQMATRLPPEVALRLMTIAMDFSDLPNKDEVAEQIRKLTGDRDPNKPMTPEEAQQAERQMQAQAEALQMQRQQAMLALEEQQAKVREINAKAAKMEADAMAAGQQGADGMAMQVRSQLSQEMDRMASELRKAQSDLANRTMQIRSDADAKLEAARIDADAKIRIAEIQAASNERIKALEDKLAAMEQGGGSDIERQRLDLERTEKQARLKMDREKHYAEMRAKGLRIAEDPDGELQVTTDADDLAKREEALAKTVEQLKQAIDRVASEGTQAQERTASTIAESQERLARMLQQMQQQTIEAVSAPKQIKVVRDKAGRIAGAQVTEADDPGGANEQ